MNNEYFAEMHKLIEKAKNFERMGREEEALKIYLEIHENFFPNTSDLFERPAILLEKRKRFDEAIQICEKAIKLIGEGKITGVKDNFERRINRIKSRSDYDGKYKTSGNKSVKKNTEGTEKPKSQFKLFSFFRKSEETNSKSGETVAKKEEKTHNEIKHERVRTVEAEKPSDEKHKERVHIQPRKPDSGTLKENHVEDSKETEVNAAKEKLLSSAGLVKEVVLPVEPQEPEKVQIKANDLAQKHLPEKEKEEEKEKQEQDQESVAKVTELKVVTQATPRKEIKMKFKIPKLKLSGLTLQDFKNMISELKNFKFSDMKFFIFDLSEIKQGKFKFRKPSKSEWLAMGIVATAIIILAVAIANKPKSQFEIAFDTSGFEWSQDITTDISEENKKDLPPITATMIDTAVKKTQSMPGVRMAGVLVQKNVVGFIVMTTPEADRRQAKEAAETFIKALASAAAAENSDLSGPGPLGYGELFDYYALIVVAGENYDNLLVKGSKNPKAPGIYWRNE